VKLNIVPARTGLLWVKLGIRTFLRQPLALAGLFFMFTMTVILLAAVPVIGPMAAVVLMPAATLGMMVATEQASVGKFPMPSVLVSAFRAGRQRARSMLILGGLYALVLLAIVTMTSLMVPDTPAPTPLAPGTPGVPAGPTAVPPGTPAMFIAMALQLPFTVLFSHAPALVHWYGVTPAKSLFFSAVAFLRNFGAFVLFGIGWLAFLFAVGAFLSIIYALFGAAPSPQTMAPVALVVLAMMSTSMYFTFRDSFVPATDDEALASAVAEPPPGGQP